VTEVEAPAITALADGLQKSDRSAPTVVYLAKFLAADLERCCLSGDELRGDENVEFVGICRVFSGTLRPNVDLFVTSAGEGGDGSSRPSSTHATRALRVQRVFLLKGSFLQEVADVLAGTIAAVHVIPVAGAPESRVDVSELGVERFLTLCDVADGPCFETPYSSQAFAIVRVNIEPQKITDSDALYRGLRLLHRADPSVSLDVRSTGENVLGCCGDEHLKRCITDLQNLYARGVPLTISPPLIAIRESIAFAVDPDRIDPKASAMWLPSWAVHIADASTDASSHYSGDRGDEDTSDATGVSALLERISMAASGITSVWTANRKACFRVSAMAIPKEVLEWMDGHADELEAVIHRHTVSPAFVTSGSSSLADCLQEVSLQLRSRLQEGGVDLSTLAVPEGKAASICGANVGKGSRTLLVDAAGTGWELWDNAGNASDGSTAGTLVEHGCPEGVPKLMLPSVLAGFKLASNAGPLCEEPMRGVVFVIHGCQFQRQDASVGALGGGESGYVGQTPPVATAAAVLAASAEPYGPMSGQVMVATKEACRCCLFRRGVPRICEAMLALEVQSEQAMLGKVYAVLGKRRAKVIEEGLREGTSLFYIRAHLPLADSFGFAHDLRSAASGQVSFHCAFSHWEQSEDEPFQEGTLTAEEIEELGDQPLPPNVARRLIDAIRKRKGLATDEKVVKAGTAQRTITRNK
jgi:ribosome assembly protein 1